MLGLYTSNVVLKCNTQLNIAVGVLLSQVIFMLLYFHSSFSYLTVTPQKWDSVPQISQQGHLQYRKLLLILHFVSKINPSERQEDMLLFLKGKRFFLKLIYDIYIWIGMWNMQKRIMTSCCPVELCLMMMGFEMLKYSFTSNYMLSCKVGELL